jgi:vacuolar-type H+-ATPase subunit I/STV1
MANDYAIDAAGDVDQANEDIQEAEQELEMEQREDYEDENRGLRISRLETMISNARSRLYRAEERYARANERRYECERSTREASEGVDEVEEILGEKQRKYDEIEDSWNDLIAEQQHRITILEEERDSIIASLNQEAQNLTKKVGTIRTDVSSLISRKQHLISEIDSNDTPIAHNLSLQGAETYAYIPFFLAKLSESAASRFVVISPARLRRDRSTTEKLGGFILGRVPTLTEPRDQILSSFARILHELLQTNHAVGKEIRERAGKLNLLNSTPAREGLLKGIDSLCSEGILSDRMTQKIKSNFPVRR